MAKELTPVAQYVSVTCPEGGDNRTAASVEAGLQDLADNVEFLREFTPGAAGFYTVDIPLGAPSDPSSFSFVNGPFALQQGSTATPFHFVQLPLPRDLLGTHEIKIADVTAYFLPANIARGGNPPASQPEITLWRQPQDGSGSGVSIQAQQLAAGSEASYETAQILTMIISAGGHTVLTDHTYWVSFEGESGANSDVGLLLTRITVTFEMVP